MIGSANDANSQSTQLFQLFRSFSHTTDECKYQLGVHQLSSHPYIVTNAGLRQMQTISGALHSFMPLFIRAWHTNSEIGEKLRQIIKLPTRIEQLLLDHYRNHESATLHAASYTIGFLRPDFIIARENNEDVYKLCEINARFTVNGFMVSYYLNEAARVYSCTPNNPFNEARVTCFPHMQSFLSDLHSRLFLHHQKVWVIVEAEKACHGIVLLKEKYKEQVVFISPRNVKVGKDSNVLLDAQSGEIIDRCMLELHQYELFNLSDEVLRALLHLSDSGNCVNDLRTILLVHDKRLFSILNGPSSDEINAIVSQHQSPLVNEERPTIIETLRKHVVPTVTTDSVREENNQHVWLHLSGGYNHSIIFKPSFHGKGVGITLSHEFPTLSAFLAQLPTPTPDNELETYFSSGIIQPFIKTATKRIPYPTLGEDGRIVDWVDTDVSAIGTLCCLDGVFYGPGIFRLKNEPIIALSRGGLIMIPTLHLPEVPAECRFAVPLNVLRHPHDHQQAVLSLRAAMRYHFGKHGALLVTIEDATEESVQSWSDSMFENVVLELMKGEPIPVTKKQNAPYLWEVRPNGNTSSSSSPERSVARSHTNEEFECHSDASWEDPPPQAFAIHTKQCDRKGGGLFSMINVQQHILSTLTEDELQQLKRTNIQLSVPPEFSDGNNHTQALELPIMLGENRMRYRHDILDDRSSSPAIVAKIDHLLTSSFSHNKENPLTRLLPERSVILLDNQRFLHARTAILDSRRHLQRIRFHLQDQRSPQLDLVLLESEYHTVDLNTVPLQYSFTGINNITEHFLPSYWSPSGQSGVSSTLAKLFNNVVGTYEKGNNHMRKLLAQAILPHGYLHAGIRCLNIFTNEKLYRSGEIFSTILSQCEATNFPFGANGTVDELSLLLSTELFSINAIAGLSSKIVELAHFANAGKLSLKSIRVILFAGEPLASPLRDLLRNVCAPDVIFIGFYGGAECGVYAFQTPRTILQSQSDPLQTEIYQYVDDAVHVEILNSNNNNSDNNEACCGDLVITNLLRKPAMLRFHTGDRASWVGTSRKYFKLAGRDPTSRGVPVGVGWLYFQKIVNDTLLPLDLAHRYCQIEISTQNQLIEVTLVLHLPSEEGENNQRDTCKLSELRDLFSTVITDTTGSAGVHTSLRVITNFDLFKKSTRSRKIVNFVDLRS